jgi:UDP-N-acetylmuramate: L-alanyl-gamma-D-glutamyl-meso-diaminopimelate ligase
MKSVHFIAIGGAVMHQLALALHRDGVQVTGSDDAIHDPAKTALLQTGLLPAEVGWFPEKITAGLDAVVLGMHAKGDNPELLQAQKLGLPVYSFPEYVYQVAKDKLRVAIAGSHGKTTITSMIMHVLQKRDKPFDYLVGAKLEGFAQSVQLSDAPIMLLEGDEYPASVLEKRPKIFFYHPQITLLSGIAWDHINVFPTYENYVSQFQTYLRNLDAGTTLVYNADDSEVVRVVTDSGTHLRAIPYSMPHYRYDEGKALLKTDSGTELPLAVFGRHNLLNLMGAKAICETLGVPADAFYEEIRDFSGASKRLEKAFETEKIIAFRDFAHAPSKLQATLDAVREAYPNRKLIALFELHTYSSLNKDFLDQYAGSMDAADDALVYFSSHALQLKRLESLQPETVHAGFGRPDLQVFDRVEVLQQEVAQLVAQSAEAVCLLLMSSGTFEGTDWQSVLDRPA